MQPACLLLRFATYIAKLPPPKTAIDSRGMLSPRSLKAWISSTWSLVWHSFDDFQRTRFLRGVSFGVSEIYEKFSFQYFAYFFLKKNHMF